MVQLLFYYLILIPFSWLPLKVIYLLSSLVNFFLTKIFKYRYSIASKNIDNAFPELDIGAKKNLIKNNYKHLSDLLGEGIKNMTISENALKKLMQIENLELFDQLYKEKKSVILMSSHCNNWEYLITLLNIALPHKAVGIGKPLTNQVLNIKLNNRRERFGLKVVHAKNYKTEIPKLLNQSEPIAILVLADQSPSVDRAFWTNFFHQETAFSFGGELLAHQYNMPVVFLKTLKIKRGHYKIIPSVITIEPIKENYGKITSEYVSLLEKNIREQPSNWLWTHKRWKHKTPENLKELKENHKKLFEERFKK